MSGARTWSIGSSVESRRRNVCDCASSTRTRPHAGDEAERNVNGRRAKYAYDGMTLARRNP
jgi:hypothetical protein